MGALIPGTMLGGCRIEAVVGRGGMGIVYRARQLDLDRDVAVKVIAPELVQDPRSRNRFLTEARAASAVEHPNVLPVHGAGVAEGRAYLVMRYVAGDDLRTVVRRDGALPPDRAAEIAARLGEALDAIHRAGYVHRDVKPQNVMIDAGGHVYLSDFGLAKQALATGGPTTSAQWVGTLDYVAPEQIRGERIDARADVYALGGVLYFMLTARVPFERETDHAKLWAHLMDEPPLPSALRPALPAELDAVVARALAKDPARRQPSAGDLGAAARAAAVGRAPPPERGRPVASGDAAPMSASETTTPSPTPSTLPIAPRPRRRRAVALAALAAALGAGGLALWLVPDRGPDGDRATASRTTPTATPAPALTPHVGDVITDVGLRPRAVAVAAGAVWVVSSHESHVARFDARTGEPMGDGWYVGRGAVAIAADQGVLWVAKPATRVVLGLSLRGDRPLQRIDTPLPPDEVAAGPSGLWVVVRATEDGPATLLRYGRDGRGPPQPTEFPDGIEAIAVGGGAAWVALVLRPQVVRVVAGDGEDAQQSAQLREPASELAYGAGRLWASIPGLDAVARIGPSGRRVSTTEVAPEPAGLAVAGGRVFVASFTTHTVAVIDPERFRRTPGKRIEVPFNPYAMAAGAGHVWVTGIARATLTRLDY